MLIGSLQAKFALATILGAAGVAISGSNSAPETPLQSSQQAAVDSRIWMHTLREDLVSFKQFGQYGADIKPAGEHAIVLQLESVSPKVDALLLSPAPYRPIEGIFERHGEAAAAVMDEAADRLAGKDVQVFLVERKEDWARWIMNDDNAYTRTLFENADVISVSMMPLTQGDQNKQFSAGTLTTADDIRKADEFWKNSHAVMVWGSGNNGTDMAIDLERAAAFPAIRADTLLRVGEAARDPATNQVYIIPYSSRAGVSFVTTEPYAEDMRFRFYNTGPELRQAIAGLFGYRAFGAEKTNAALFADRLKLPVAESRTYEDKRIDLQACHPDFAGAAFEGKDVLQKDNGWIAAHPDETQEAFTNCVVAAADYFRNRDATADAAGFVTGMIGSSYSGPHAAGMVGAMREKYPQLSEYDLDAAALMASVPAGQVKRADGHFDAVAYRNNGRGLPHNSYEAGFGFLDEKAYTAMVARLAKLQAAHPKLATQEKHAQSVLYNYRPFPVAESGPTDYKLEVADDIVALRTNLALRFANGPYGVPAKIQLIDPRGASVYVSPTKIPDGGMVYALASTDGHFGGYTKGKWTIRVPAGSQLEEAQLSIAGTQKGGLIDRALDGLGHKMKPPAPATLNIAALSSHKGPG